MSKLGPIGSRLIRGCDLALNADPCSDYVPFSDGGPIVRHGDGALVSSSRPASPGEPLSLYALGLGFVEGTLDNALLGKAPTAPVSLKAGLQVSFSPEIAGFAAKPALAGTTGPLLVKPDFVGLIPGAVGIYQLNVTIPSDLVVTGSCYSGQGSAIISNVKIRVTGSSSLDELGICVVANNP